MSKNAERGPESPDRFAELAPRRGVERGSSALGQTQFAELAPQAVVEGGSSLLGLGRDRVARILPELTIANEFFWTAGNDGCLRFRQCTRCQALVHPPGPMCRYCRGTDLAVTEVSGLARLIGFTVNHRMRIPGLEPPYVVGQVAIEDAGLRVDDIDGLSTYPGGLTAAGMGEGGVTALESSLRIDPTCYNGGGETFGPVGSVIAAMLAVSAGLVRHVLCFRTVWQATHDALTRAGKISGGSSRVGPPMDYTLPFGASSAAHTSSTAARTSHATASCRSTRTGGSCRTGALTAWDCCRRRWCSCAATPGSGRSRAATWPWSAAEVSRHPAHCC